jgi:glycosyltransferase involved in cell wall biosynthesis
MDERHKTVILLSHEYPPYVFGGVAMYSKQVAEWLSNNGWKVFVVSGKADVSKRVNIERVGNKLTIIRVYFPEIPPRWLLYAMVVRNYLEKLLHRHDAVILSNSPLTWLITRKLRKLGESMKRVTIFHGSIYSLLAFFQYVSRSDIRKLSLEELAYYAEIPLYNYLIKKDLLISDHYIFVSRHVAMEYKQLYSDLSKDIDYRGAVIYPGIEYEYLAKLRQNVKRVKKGKIVIAYVGRLYYTKGITHAVKVIEYLVKERREKDVTLWIFGRGPLESWLNQYIKRKELATHIKYFKFVERTMLLRLLAKYVDVLLHPSLYEGAPLAVMEAQSLGIPVITFDLPWTQEFILQRINGYKARYSDITQLSKYLIKATEIEQEKVISTAKRYDRKISFSTLENLLIESLLN